MSGLYINLVTRRVLPEVQINVRSTVVPAYMCIY